MIQTMVVEDDPIAAQAHVRYVQRVPGFVVAAQAGTGADALRKLSSSRVDLVLLDLNLPDMHGLEVCRTMRAAGHRADVIAVTSARDLGMVRSAVSLGVVQYLLKPFMFATLRDKLERYAAYRDQVLREQDATGQREVDRLFSTLRAEEVNRLPKGMSPESLETIIAVLRESEGARSAAEVGASVGMSRVAARRYLEHLSQNGLVNRSSRYGGAGRPEIEYHWRH